MKKNVRCAWLACSCMVLAISLSLQTITLFWLATGLLGVILDVAVFIWLSLCIVHFRFKKSVNVAVYLVSWISVVISVIVAYRESAIYCWIVTFLLLSAAIIQIVCLEKVYGYRCDIDASGSGTNEVTAHIHPLCTCLSLLLLLLAIVLMSLPFSLSIPFSPNADKTSIHLESWFNYPFLLSYADFFTILASSAAVIWLVLCILRTGFHKSTESGIGVFGVVSTVSSIISVFYWNTISAWSIVICLSLLVSFALQLICIWKASRKTGFTSRKQD